MNKRKENIMPNWELMRLVVAKNGEHSLRPLTKAERLMAPYYLMLLTRASEAKSGNPIFSGYHVKGCMGAGELAIAQSENVESGNFDSLHLEVAASAALASRQNSIEHPVTPVLAIVAGRGAGTLEKFAMPCGGCRDFLRDTVGEDCVIICATPDGGTAVIATLADVLFENYARVPLDRLDVLTIAVAQTIGEGEALMDNPFYDPQKCPLRNYFISITTGESDISDRMYFGAMSNEEDFHPIYPAEDAIRAMRRAKDPYIKSVLIVAEGDGATPPSVMYRDRQRLLGAAIRREILTGKHYDPPARLFTHTDGRITGAWKTSVKEWLPLPFSVKNFGPKFLSAYVAHLKKKYGRAD